MDTPFIVNGRKFFPLGGQARNSSAYMPEETETFWRSLEAVGGNTGEIPIYWEKAEPQEGKFDFKIIDTLIKQARERNKKLILLWFATWKNGNMKFAPTWVKEDRKRFKRVLSHDGAEMSVLSSHCSENLKADSGAFKEVMRHIHKVDDKERTIIGIQVENEPGIVGRTYRDHGPDGEREFQSAVPAFLIDQIAGQASKKPASPVFKVWEKNGSKKFGTWPEVFGLDGAEFLSAYSIAKYIDTIAKEGKSVHNIPMLVNVWLDGALWNQPGTAYPSGAPEENVLDIWKWTTKYIDIIAPDIYKQNPGGFNHHCEVYNREDNALFVPESWPGHTLNACNMFTAIGKYDCIGYFGFGLEQIFLDDGTINPSNNPFVGSCKALSAALPLLTKYRGTGKIFTIFQGEGMADQLLPDLGDFKGLAQFHDNTMQDVGYFGDYHHCNKDIMSERGRGLVIQADKNEFFLLGAGFAFCFREKAASAQYPEVLRESLMNYISIEEGHFDAEENWVVDRLRNGDECDFGIWVHPDIGVVRVVVDYSNAAE